MPFGTCIDVETYRNKLENHIIHLSLEFHTAYFKTNCDKKGDLKCLRLDPYYVLLATLYGKAHILLRLDCYYHKIRPALSPDVYSYLVCPVKLLASKNFVSWCYKKEYVAKTKLNIHLA